MSLTICLAPANTMAYPNGGGHLWVYLQWALGLRALGCRVIWLEGIDARAPAEDSRENVAAMKVRLQPYGLAESLAPFSLDAGPLPPEVAHDALSPEPAVC